MSQNDGFDPTDPLGAWRSLRDANLDAWSKGMSTLVNTEAFSRAIGMQLDSYLASSAPFKKAIEQYMEAYLAQLHMPSRAEVVSLAQRMTNIEFRLDDLDGRLDGILAAVKALPAPPALPALPAPAPAPALDERLAALEQRADAILALLSRSLAPADEAAPEAAPEAGKPAARSRKPRPVAPSTEEES